MESIESDDMRYKLAEIASSLRNCLKLIESPDMIKKRAEDRAKLVASVASSLTEERKYFLDRFAFH